MKILICDDEEYTREGIVEAIDWDSFGIKEIMQAKNGMEAEQIAKWFKPDIVITDIRMPKLDGIGFAKRLLQEKNDCRLIFISGYMEIDYYKSALQLSAIDYIEKPININDLKAAIQKAVKEINEEKRKEEALQVSDLYKENRLFYVLTHKDMVKTYDKQSFEIPLTLQHKAVCIICQGDNIEEVKKLVSKQGLLVVSNVEELNRWEWICFFPKKEEYRIVPMLHRILESFPDIIVAKGMIADDYRNIYNSYSTAISALNQSFYREDLRFFQIDELEQKSAYIDPGIYGEFIKLIKEEPKVISDWFKNLFDFFMSNTKYLRSQIEVLMISILMALYKEYPQAFNIGTNDEEEYIVNLIKGSKNINEIYAYVQVLLDNIQKECKENEGSNRVIKGAILYIKQHYTEVDLSVSDISEYLHFSSDYLNVLFKQEMKCTLKQYISNYRIEKAKEMLSEGYDKVNEVATACGYANGNYFAKVFKEATSMTPQEYRKGFDK